MLPDQDGSKELTPKPAKYVLKAFQPIRVTHHQYTEQAVVYTGVRALVTYLQVSLCKVRRTLNGHELLTRRSSIFEA